MPMKLDKYMVGKRYSKALFELAIETKQEEVIFSEIEALKVIITENPEMGTILVDPRLNLLQKREILSVLSKEFSPLMRQFLQMLFDYKRIDNLPNIIEEFEQKHAAHSHIVLATVTTAVALSEAQQSKLAQTVSKRFDAETALLENVVNPEIMGGVVVEARNTVLDGSVKTRLDRVRRSLLN